MAEFKFEYKFYQFRRLFKKKLKGFESTFDCKKNGQAFGAVLSLTDRVFQSWWQLLLDD